MGKRVAVAGRWLSEVDLKDDPKAAADAINQWAATATHGRIPQIVGSVSGATRILL